MAAEDAGRSALSIQMIFVEHFSVVVVENDKKKMHKLSEGKCRLNLVISSQWHIAGMFKVR